LYEYCVAHGVAHRRSGKLIVASDEKQMPELQEIQRKAHANGVTDVVWMTREQALALEPELHCVAALYSPSTGIIDSHALMLAYRGEAEDAGAFVAFRSPVLSGRVRSDGFELAVGGAEPATIRCRLLVNAAGLFAPSL